MNFPASAIRSAQSTTLGVVLCMVMASFVVTASAQQAHDDHNKHLDVRSSSGDLHVGQDADAHRAGLPLYPGARLRDDQQNSERLNLGVLTESFGMKLIVAKYESDDMPVKIVNFYRDQLKKYGSVLECHTREHGADAHSDSDDKDTHSKQLKCENEDKNGPVTELKVGTEDNQHVVAIEAAPSGKGSLFTLVYVHTRGKQADI